MQYNLCKIVFFLLMRMEVNPGTVLETLAMRQELHTKSTYTFTPRANLAYSMNLLEC